MSEIRGVIRKMKTELPADGIAQYQLRLGDVSAPLNPCIGEHVSFAFTGQMTCIQCDRAIKKTFQQGYCYPCCQRLNECGGCLIFPERCQVESGNCDPTDWAHAHCSAPQILYLANSSGLKVGITRQSQMPHRWIDQGARTALPVLQAHNRYRVGQLEVLFKTLVSDRTVYQRMLKNEVPAIDLLAERDRLCAELSDSLVALGVEEKDSGIDWVQEAAVCAIDYPVQCYPTRIKTLSFDRTPEISGQLLGIKAQYLILDTGVLNMRKFGGYWVTATLPASAE